MQVAPEPSTVEILRHQALRRFSISRRNGPFFSISSWRIECSFLEMFSIVKILKTKFSFSSRNSRFWRKFSFSSRLIEWDFANRFSSRESKFWEKKLSFSSRFFPQFLFQLWWEIIFCYLVGFWPTVFCRKGKYFKNTVLCCWAMF